MKQGRLRKRSVRLGQILNFACGLPTSAGLALVKFISPKALGLSVEREGDIFFWEAK